MRKLLFIMVAMFTLGISSCGNSTNASQSANDSDSVAVDTVAVDTIAVDTLAVDSAAAE